jgi:biopolymer transport protein ExbB
MFEHFTVFSWFVFGLLAILSVLSWYIIFTGALSLFLFDRDFERVKTKWSTVSGYDGISDYSRNDRSPLVNLLVAGAFEWAKINLLDLSDENKDRFMSDMLRHEVRQMCLGLDPGLTFLALIASVAPFIGLLGTVVGIYHTLSDFSVSSSEPTLVMISGSVGETLVMTAVGLIVAIPAVFAYNIFAARIRIDRERINSLAGVYHKLLVYRLKSDEL